MPQHILFFKALAAGERWITVHPNGKDQKGVPVLIRPAGDGAYRVVGGAGGKLNMLKLTGVKDAATYKADAAKSAATRREIQKERRAEDRKTGIHQAKVRAKENVKAELKQHEAKFVETVAQALGWKPEDMRFPEEKFQNATPTATKKAAEDHARELFHRAQEAVDLQRKRLVQDAEARAEADIAEVPLVADDPTTLTVDDLAPVGNEGGGGLGFSANYGERAKEAGLTDAELTAEADKAKPSDKTPEERQAARTERKEKGEAIRKELEGIREAGPKVDPRATVEAKKAVELIKAKKALDAARKVGRAEVKRLEQATSPEQVEPKAFVIEVEGKAVDQDVVKDLENDLRTLRTRGFLDELGKQVPDLDSVGKHVGIGAFNSVNALALAAGGAALMDRSVVDVLGSGGAAQVLARRLATDLTAEELDQVKEAMGRFHVDHYMKATTDSLREAREWQEMAQEIELGEARNATDLRVAQELNAKRREFVANAQRVLGQALGEMETNAALVAALEAPKKDELVVSLGTTTPEDAIRQARAIGLQRGDYQVEKIGASTMLTVNAAGQDRLTQPIAKEDLERVRGALDIIEGRQDEDDWLPKGVAHRPEMAMDAKPGAAPRIAKPFPMSPGDVDRAVQDYIGGRAADGDSPAQIVRDLLSEDVIQRAGDRDAFMAAVNKHAPLYDGDGKMIRAETHAEAFEKLADAYVAGLGGERTPLHRQQVKVDDTTVEALHNALAQHPHGAAAFKPIGELTPQDQAALRSAFLREHGRTDANAESLRQELERHQATEPEKEVDDMFGRGRNPEWTDWNTRRDELGAKVNEASMSWPKYVAVMGSPTAAYAAMQDVVRSDVLRAFADHHNKLRPDQPIRTGRTAIANDLDHLTALDPDARERRLADQRELADRLRNRTAGKYAAGGVHEKLAAAREAEAAQEQAQMGLFGAVEDTAPAEAEAPVKEEPLELGQRVTIGHAAERQVAGMMEHVGAMFRAGRPVTLWRPSMSGKYVARQRAVKLIRHNKRTMLAMGTGSGKTSIMLAGFTDAHADGAAKKGIFVVPSVVQGQFHGEALTLLEPGKYRWHADPGASREERIAAYKDPDTHFSVVTHQGFRDDMLHLAAKRESVTPAAISDKLARMKPEERATYMKDLLAAEGIPADYLAVDEGHNLLNRQGKANSGMANVIDAVSDNMGHYVSATADPVKNDASEAFDVLAKMDRRRYSDRAAFMRKYGVNTGAAKEGLKREMARHFYTAAIDPGVKAHREQVKVDLSPEQHEELGRLDKAAADARLARMSGKVATDAMRALSPGSFEGVPEAQHEAVAKELQRSIGIIHNTAKQHAINGGAKTEKLADLAKARKGKPGVVFAHSLQRVHEIAERLKKDGHRVETLTGADSSQEKDRKKGAFKAGEHDIIVMSDAGAVGANMQTGKWLAQYDTPQTAMTHYQRGARIHRMGQTEDVELLDLVADHPDERRARDRLAKKYELRGVMTSALEGLDDTGIAGMLHQVRTGKAEAEQPAYMPAGDDAPQPEPDEQADIFNFHPGAGASPPGLAGVEAPER